MRPQRPHCPARAPHALAAPGTPANRPTEHLGVQPQPDPRLAAPFPTATGCAATPPPDNCAGPSGGTRSASRRCPGDRSVRCDPARAGADHPAGSDLSRRTKRRSGRATGLVRRLPARRGGVMGRIDRSLGESSPVSIDLRQLSIRANGNMSEVFSLHLPHLNRLQARGCRTHGRPAHERVPGGP